MERTRFSRTFRSGNLQSKKALGRLCIEDVKEWRIIGKLERDRIIVAIAEKRRSDKGGKVRRMTLMSLANKVCATMLTNRLNKEEKEKRIIREWGASGFRWYLSFSLNYLVERELKRSRKVVATLVDFKVAVNLVDMTILRRSLE